MQYNETASAESDNQVISIDDLGLDVLDDLEKVIPGFFTPVKVYDQTIAHREKVGNTLDDLPQIDQERLLAYLSEIHAPTTADSSTVNGTGPTHALILFSSSELTCYLIMTVCKQEGFYTFATDEEENLDHIIKQSLTKDLTPVLLIDQPESSTVEVTAALISKVLNKYPGLAVFHLASTFDFTAHLDSIRAGARALLPKPDKLRRPDYFVQESIYLLDTLKKCLKITPSASAAKLPHFFKQCMDEITMLRELTDITAVIDGYLATVLGRAITFVSRKSELTCDCINRSGSVQPISISIQAVGNSPLHTVLANGSAFFGESTDSLLKESIYSLTEPPLSQKVLVAPLKCLGRVVALIYADFGTKSHAEIDLDLISIMTTHAGLVYENALYKKKFAKMLQTQH